MLTNDKQVRSYICPETTSTEPDEVVIVSLTHDGSIDTPREAEADCKFLNMAQFPSMALCVHTAFVVVIDESLTTV